MPGQTKRPALQRRPLRDFSTGDLWEVRQTQSDTGIVANLPRDVKGGCMSRFHRVLPGRGVAGAPVGCAV